jgi:hypothetical protein
MFGDVGPNGGIHEFADSRLVTCLPRAPTVSKRKSDPRKGD